MNTYEQITRLREPLDGSGYREQAPYYLSRDDIQALPMGIMVRYIDWVRNGAAFGGAA